jgi:hypothetical protein
MIVQRDDRQRLRRRRSVAINATLRLFNGTFDKPIEKPGWGGTDNNRKARFYALTPAGRCRLTAEKTEWNRMVSIMHALLTNRVEKG